MEIIRSEDIKDWVGIITSILGTVFSFSTVLVAMYAVFIARRQLRQSEKSIIAAAKTAQITIQSSLESTKTTIEHDAIVNKLLKTVDVSIHCSQRYDALSNLRVEILSLQNEKAKKESSKDGKDDAAKADIDQKINILESKRDALTKDYYRRFWALKSDQFDYWLMGVLDHDAFFDWSFYLTVKILKENGGPIQGDTADRLHTPLKISWTEWSAKDDGVNHGGSNPAFVAFTNQLFEIAKEIAKMKEPIVDILINQQVIDAMEEVETKPGGAGGISAAEYRKLVWEGKLTFDRFKQMTRIPA